MKLREMQIRNQRFAYSFSRVTLPPETKSKMEDFSGSLFGLNNFLSAVVEEENIYFYTIQVLVITSSTSVPGRNILGVHKDFEQPHGPSECTSSGHQNSAGK